MRIERHWIGIAAVLAVLPATAFANSLDGKLAIRKKQAEAAARASQQTPSGALASFATDANALLAAMDVDPAIVISPTLTGDQRQAGVFPTLGVFVPTNGANFAWLSSGIAGAGTPQAVDPAGVNTQPGWDSPSTCASGGGNDCITLEFSFNVPSGMHSIRFDFNFMSAEFPEFVGSMFNDSFIVSMSSPSNNYANIVFDSHGNPISINSAFFNQPCTTMQGTGFDIFQFDGTCDAGATGILTTEAPVEPGETVTLSFTVRDHGDGIYDSAVFLDNFVISEEMVEGPSTSGQVIIDHLSPKSGPLAGGTSVLIHGEGFENVQQVAFGGIPALFNVLDEFTIQALTPPHSEGPVDVAVTAQPGNSVTTGVRPGAFIYYVSPPGSPLAVMSVDPPEGPGEGGVLVAVRGSGFKGDTVITFDGEPVQSQEYINGDEIIVVTPAGSGAADIRASNPDGAEAQLEGGYVYLGNGSGDRGGNSFTENGGCACSLESTGGPVSGAAASLAVAALAFAGWLARRRGFRLDAKRTAAAAVLPAAMLVSGCGNDTSLAQVNSAPIANAGPSQEAFVGEEVTLDGSGSRDFEDGDDLEFAWKIVSKPEGSAAMLDVPTEKMPSFVADQPGLYRIGLVVTDTDGIDSGEIGFGGRPDDNLTEVVVLPFRDLRVTLSWDQPDSDLDLHLTRPNFALNAGYFNQDFDCFYGSPEPDWGTPGVESDNPLLALDVETGNGPEEITLPSPQDAGLYTVFVHVFNQHGAPPSIATVSISVDGTLVAEEVSSIPLAATDTVWRVGTLSWPEKTWTLTDQFTTHALLGGPPH